MDASAADTTAATALAADLPQGFADWMAALDAMQELRARDPAQAVPLWGTWTGFPADSLGLTVEVNVTAAPTPAEMNATQSGALQRRRAAGDQKG